MSVDSLPTAAVTVMVVDDDAEVRELLEDYLGDNGYQVLSANGGQAMRALLETHTPSVVLLDIGLPGEDGLSLARFVREQLDIGIIIVSGAGDTVDRIVGLEIGADDYLTKPFDLRELRARLKSVLRRYQREPEPPPAAQDTSHTRVRFGVAALDLVSCQLFDADGNEIPLSAAEFELLKVFAERPNRPLSRDQLMSLTQNREWDPYDRSIDIRIARLRKKVETDPDKPQAIRTKRGMGYMFVPGTR
ncbi:MAG: response regulator [Proteobacteria bacterium]|jgi:DNA-binding response OmpR family regulator|nr:response regulator [Pseudomonadota bacterium]